MGRIRARRGAFTGLLILVLGLWVGLVPFIGPSFNYSLGSDSTWDWSMNRLWLEVLPAAAAVLGGLLRISSRTRVRASLGGLLGLTGGLWLVVGPTFSTLWEHGNLGTGPAFGSTETRFLEWIGYYYGAGALMALFSAYILGFLAALPRVEPPMVPATAAPAAGYRGVPDYRDSTAQPARRRRFPRRRRGAAKAPPPDRTQTPS
jgi:hypothetical protein